MWINKMLDWCGWYDWQLLARRRRSTSDDDDIMTSEYTSEYSAADECTDSGRGYSATEPLASWSCFFHLYSSECCHFSKFKTPGHRQCWAQTCRAATWSLKVPKLPF